MPYDFSNSFQPPGANRCRTWPQMIHLLNVFPGRGPWGYPAGRVPRHLMTKSCDTLEIIKTIRHPAFFSSSPIFLSTSHFCHIFLYLNRFRHLFACAHFSLFLALRKTVPFYLSTCKLTFIKSDTFSFPQQRIPCFFLISKIWKQQEKAHRHLPLAKFFRCSPN